MSPIVQIVAAVLTVAFIAFVAYGAMMEGRTRPAHPASAAPERRPEARAAEDGDGRAGGEDFRNEALAVARDPLRPEPETSEENRG